MTTKAEDFKNLIYEELAKTARALGNAKRLEIVNLLAQGPISVEKIASHTNSSIANASKHLQVLKAAKLVNIIRRGNYIDYSLASLHVFHAWEAIREIGELHNSDIKNILTDYRGDRNKLNGISAEELIKKVSNREVILLDVRPEEEYKRGHIHKAISIPIEELQKKIKDLAIDKEIIAYCRGKFCFMADDAVQLLKSNGYNASRVELGFSEWVVKGYPIDVIEQN